MLQAAVGVGRVFATPRETKAAIFTTRYRSSVVDSGQDRRGRWRLPLRDGDGASTGARTASGPRCRPLTGRSYRAL